MILIGLGSNLSTDQLSTSEAVLGEALKMLEDENISVLECSRFYETEPVPKSDQPWFVNAVASVETTLSAEKLLDKLHRIENSLGRTRRTKWEARIADLDLLAYHDQVLPNPENWVRDVGVKDTSRMTVPHPRLHERKFVLIPLADIAPDWCHPVLGKNVKMMLRDLNSAEIVRLL